MPGPGAKNKKKSKPKQPTASGSGSGSTAAAAESATPAKSTAIYVPDIENAEGWNNIVNVLCTYFELPDLQRRSGLKKAHNNFNTIYNKLDRAYNTMDDLKVKGGIVGILTKMCVDVLLRNRLWEKGILDKIIPLLDLDETRHLALRSLNTITHAGGASIRIQIAKHSSKLANLMNSFPDDEKVAELVVMVLAHTVVAVVEGDHGAVDPKVLKTLDMVGILKAILEAIKRPYNHRRHMIEHSVHLISMASLNAPEAFKAYPSAINFLAAGLNAKDWVTRCTCLGGLIRLYRKGSEEDQNQLDPMRFVSAISRTPPRHLNDILVDYGVPRSDLYLTLYSTNEFQKAMMACLQDHDYYKLGLTQANLILKTEFSIANGMFQEEDPRTGARSTSSRTGLPFVMWVDSLPYTAKAIRAKGKPEEQDLADIIEIKFHIMSRRLSDAFALAKKGIERSPDQAYFYYALTLSADNIMGLRYAKKGLKCKNITPFVKYQMMQRAVEHAGDMGVKLLQDSPDVGGKQWEEGIAFLQSAREDGKAYLDGAPPDNRHMKNVGYWYILLSLLVREDLSPDLRELEHDLKKLQVADGFSEFIGVTPPKTNLRRAQQGAVKHYPLGVKEYGKVYAVLDAASTPHTHRGLADDDLEAWLEEMHLEDGTLEQHLRCEASEEERVVSFGNVALYRCSWCGNPSAALRKCNGCGKTRYCDGACQKHHWKSHKKECGSASQAGSSASASASAI